MPHKLGAHLSISGGYTKALERIVEIGGNCLQIFSSSPRGWNFASISPEHIEQFTKLKIILSINPVYFHASYLINLADHERIGHLSKQSLIAELQVASLIDVKGSIVHLGSFKEQKTENKYRTLIQNISSILQNTPKNTLFIIENAGTKKIGLTLEEIGQIIKDVNDNRVRVCLDTCHLHAGGYDLTSPKTYESFLESFDSLIGIDKLELWHFNDSRDPFNSFRDRHDNIGQGSVGLETFRTILNHLKTRDLPFIIETPGFEDNGPDKKNLDILKKLISHD